MQFGSKSEKLGRVIEELETRLEDLSASRGAAEMLAARAQAKGSDKSSSMPRERAPREAFPDHLQREENVLEPDLACPKCGAEMQSLGEDVSEQLGRIMATFKVIRTIRRKKICTCCRCIVQPAAPSQPIQRGIAHSSLLADMLVGKYGDHLPLYRQSAIAARENVTLDTASMGRWVGMCEALLDPLVQALQRYAMSGSKLHADDTPIPVLAPGHKKTRTARLWVYVRDDRRSGALEPPAAWFGYSPNRRGEHPEQHLRNFKGILQADAYAGYHATLEGGHVREAACHAHARRKFGMVHLQ